MDNLLQYNLTSVCLKTEFSYLSVTGDDSASFLQSQFTNDVLSLESDSLDHILSGYCNPKGRLIALIRVLRVKKSYYYLILPSELVETVFKRLNMFVLRSKVKIDLPTEKSVVVGAWGKNIKVKVGKMAQFEEMLIIRDNTCPVFGERTWIIGEKNSIQKKINNLNKISQINDFNSFYWKSSEFFSGNLWVNKSNTETFIPQSINLDLNDGVSFSKGCYPGQEIVANPLSR
jgi:folate-binding protein YgfZ